MKKRYQVSQLSEFCLLSSLLPLTLFLAPIRRLSQRLSPNPNRPLSTIIFQRRPTAKKKKYVKKTEEKKKKKKATQNPIPR